MRTATIVTGLGFGDEGKGTIVDSLSHNLRKRWIGLEGTVTVVRHNGGSQAGHNVVTDTGLHHTFSQFGAGSLQGAYTHLSRFMLVNPFNMLRERAHLDELSRIAWGPGWVPMPSVDPRALIITPLHRAANRLRELARGDGRHGSCGEGIGETVSYALAHDPLRVQHLEDRSTMLDYLHALRDFFVDELVNLDDSLWSLIVSSEGTLSGYADEYERWFRTVAVERDEVVLRETHHLIFEGAQGVLLDETYGFAPHTTWSNTTSANARTLLDEIGWEGPVLSLGVTRSYMTRHGVGPFRTEAPIFMPEPHNDDGFWQGAFRQGWLDLPLLRYALDSDRAAGGNINALAVTHVDRIDKHWKCARGDDGDPGYETVGYDLIGVIRDDLNLPVAVTSIGPVAQDKRWSLVPQRWTSEPGHATSAASSGPTA